MKLHTICTIALIVNSILYNVHATQLEHNQAMEEIPALADNDDLSVITIQEFTPEVVTEFTITPAEVSVNPSADTLIPLDDAIEGIKIELRYATSKNITGQRIYTRGTSCLVDIRLLEPLTNIQAELKSMGYGLVIWDAYQSPEAQEHIWKLIENDTLVCNPSLSTDAHAQGLAVDVTLYSLETGRKVPMPTDFDSLSMRACRMCQDLPDKVICNRELLTSVMTKHGFCQPHREWWHFEYCVE